MRRSLLGLAVALAVVPTADAHVNMGCKQAPCMRHTIKPFKRSFLGPVGACESGTTRFLRHGLRAVSSNGRYRGRYQFDMSSWRTAGGWGDPIDASWLQQAYRAVIWLKMTSLMHSWPVCGARASL